MWVDLSKSLGVKASCFQECCYPFLNFMKVTHLTIEEREMPFGIYRLFVLTLVNKKEIRVVTTNWEGLHFVGGKLL